ncbi:MAG: SDR family NAD(P)-dependent oxidoreductase [Candidatus Dormiibacterota bacterium]
MNLKGKVAVVTGSGRGLGRAYARALAAAGAAVVVNDVDAEVAEATTREIAEGGGKAVSCVCPVGSSEAADRLVQAGVDAFGRLDAMVTNAGILRDRTLLKMEDADFDAVIETHLRGTFTCGRAAARRMREQGEGGRIIVVSSLAGQLGNYGQTNYSAAKAGIACLARTWALELKRFNITVNAVVPNALTRMVATIPGMAALVEAAESGQPLPPPARQRLGIGTAEDVAALVVFLASDAAAEVTGQAIGLGGDKLSLWGHPREVAVAYREGGWSADGIAEVWGTSVGARLEPYGIPMLGGGGS